MTKYFYLVLLLIFMMCISDSAKPQQQDTTKLSIAEVVIIHSQILNEDRKIYIYSPVNREELLVQDPMPVLYLMDGEVHTSFVSSEINYLSTVYTVLPKMIVVGIGNYNYDRFRDLTPVKDPDFPGTPGRPSDNAGGAENFLKFIKEEVMPYIGSHYRTSPYKIFSGHSLGGLMAIHCLNEHPDMFNAYIAISPSLWWDKDYVLKNSYSKLEASSLKNKRLFFSDANEGGHFHQTLLDLEAFLKEKNIPGLKFKYLSYPEETHGSEPVKAEYDALRFIFSQSWQPSLADTTAALIKKFYSQLSEEYGYTILPPENIINNMGYTVLSDPSRISEALELFKFNVENYPESFNVYDSIGDAYAQKGDTQNAISNYKKALQINPDSKETIKKLKEINKN